MRARFFELRAVGKEVKFYQVKTSRTTRFALPDRAIFPVRTAALPLADVVYDPRR